MKKIKWEDPNPEEEASRWIVVVMGKIVRERDNLLLSYKEITGSAKKRYDLLDQACNELWDMSVR